MMIRKRVSFVRICCKRESRRASRRDQNLKAKMWTVRRQPLETQRKSLDKTRRGAGRMKMTRKISWTVQPRSLKERAHRIRVLQRRWLLSLQMIRKHRDGRELSSISR